MRKSPRSGTFFMFHSPKTPRITFHSPSRTSLGSVFRWCLMMIHRSLKVEEDLWCRMEEKARVRGFTSTNAYLRHVIQEDLSGGTLEEAEERLVSTISKLSAHVQSIGAMHQASFATLWALLELFVSTF